SAAGCARRGARSGLLWAEALARADKWLPVRVEISLIAGVRTALARVPPSAGSRRFSLSPTAAVGGGARPGVRTPAASSPERVRVAGVTGGAYAPPLVISATACGPRAP